MSGDVRRTTAKRNGDNDLLALLDEKNRLLAKYNRYVAIKVDMSEIKFNEQYKQKQRDAYDELIKIDHKIDRHMNG